MCARRRKAIIKAKKGHYGDDIEAEDRGRKKDIVLKGIWGDLGAFDTKVVDYTNERRKLPRMAKKWERKEVWLIDRLVTGR